MVTEAFTFCGLENSAAGTKKEWPGFLPATLSNQAFALLRGGEVDGFGAAGVSFGVEADALTFGQGAHAGLLNGCGVDEYVLAAAVRRDKAEAFSGIEELHCSNLRRHVTFLIMQKKRPSEMPGRREKLGKRKRRIGNRFLRSAMRTHSHAKHFHAKTLHA
jgi:hypothetical protein